MVSANPKHMSAPKKERILNEHFRHWRRIHVFRYKSQLQRFEKKHASKNLPIVQLLARQSAATKDA